MKLSTEIRDRLLSIGFPILLLLLWEHAVYMKWIDGNFFPPPSVVLTALWGLITKGLLLGKFWLIPEMIKAGNWAGVQQVFSEGDLWVSLVRIFFGFLLGAVPGILLGVIMGMNRSVRVALDPILSAIYVLPKIAILPIIMLILGTGEESKIVTVGISSFFLVLFNTSVGVQNIEPIFFEAAKNYGANRWQLFRHVIIPGAMPVIFTGLRLSLGTALIVIIAAEFVASQSGLGFRVWYSWQTLLIPEMFAGLLVIMLLGVLFTSGLQSIERRFMPWQREERSVEIRNALLASGSPALKFWLMRRRAKRPANSDKADDGKV